jgi:hypothetical protein
VRSIGVPARSQEERAALAAARSIVALVSPVDHLDRALFVIAFNALGCIADPRFALPVAPASVFFGGCALVGRG